MDANTVISVRNVTKTYKLFDRHSDRVREAFHPLRRKYHRPFNALTNVSFEVGAGEVFGIIGRNGSGKSTLLQVVCGILQPTSGMVRTAGRLTALLELGAGFNPEYTGRENVFMYGSVMGFSAEEMDERFEELALFADIGEFIDQKVKIYSSGMFVRLAFAVATCVRPRLLVVDEALSVGDVSFQHKCMRRIRQMVESGASVLLVSHGTDTVKRLCRRALWLEKGEARYLGEAAALKNNTLIPYRQQKGEIPKNFNQLFRAARGGLVFQPTPGIFQNVAVLDFSSKMASIMIKYNVSPETVVDIQQAGEGFEIPELGVKILSRPGLFHKR